MRKVYHLSSCSTCQRILSELRLAEKGFVMQDIKAENISAAELDALKEEAGSYDALFSRRAMKYKSMGFDKSTLSEKDIRGHILSEYTFLKRPVIVCDGAVFIGNAPKTVEAAAKAIA